jgi:hypothetical protein
MTHEEALNKLLTNCCPMNNPEVGGPGRYGIGEYVITMHCADMLVKARPQGDGTYDIVSVEHM